MTYRLKIENVSRLGSVKNVQFAVWSAEGGQDDLRWYQGKKGTDGSWTASADIRNHKTAGTYHVHVYVTLSNNSQIFAGGSSFAVSKPALTVRTENYQKAKGTFDVVIENVKSPSGVSRIQVPVWCAGNQSDIKWYDAVKQANGSYRVTVSMANHKYAVGAYKVHTYITAGNGVFTFGGGAPSQTVERPAGRN